MLVVADPLPSDAMSALADAFGAHSIRRLSDLRARVSQAARSLPSAGRRLYEPTRAALTSSRQLLRASGWAMRTHQKLLLWALEG